MKMARRFPIPVSGLDQHCVEAQSIPYQYIGEQPVASDSDLAGREAELQYDTAKCCPARFTG